MSYHVVKICCHMLPLTSICIICFVHWFVASSERICSFLSMRRPMQCVCCCFCRPTAEASKHQAVKQEVTSEWQKRRIDMKWDWMKLIKYNDIKSKQRNRTACESERWLTLHISEIGLGVPDGPGSFNETDLDTWGLWRSDKAEDRCLGREDSDGTDLGMFETKYTLNRYVHIMVVVNCRASWSTS